ncbi:hypothetical protein O181_007198 [Austropuccinia psidii MF-1]|uniref:Uncharacterized protein n=1 Tax=Austropuccinia psidii MF-1 TaxID=1389203 RepID=A0A9Q3GHB7_9BASI|nr:hypothetical protein [Austropuccinia psidii MF-1]
MDIYISPYKKYYMFYKDKDCKMLTQIQQGVMNYWHILKELLKEEEIVKYSYGCNPLPSKLQIKKIKYYHAKKREESKEKDPVGSTSKPQASQPTQEGKKKNKINWRKPYSSSYRIPRTMFSTWPEP